MPVHISARVSWHNDGWNGCICSDPTANTYCVGAQSYPGQHIAEKRSLEWEIEHPARPGKYLDRIPPCCYSYNAFGLDEAPAEVMPMTSPLRLTSGPPLLPGLMAASVWIHVLYGAGRGPSSPR